MKNKFLIGELAKLFHVSTDTLRHYDRIDLLKSECNSGSKYRYYSLRSFFKLSRILFLKNLDISLEEIKTYMNNKNRNNLLDLLKNKESEIDAKIIGLINLKKKINAKVGLLESINGELDQIKIKKIPERIGVFLDMNYVENDFEIIEAFKQNERYLKNSSWLIEGQIYTSLSKENMNSGILNKFRYFIEVLTLESQPCERVKVIPGNDYACIAFLGPYRDMGKHYKLLIKWINNNGYEIVGDSIEKNIVDYDFSDSEHEYISEIQIPIRRV
ncbi:MAG: MerR family transcriptional regulator [Clostridium sp.]|uniref:MerR family transcriptional regulator n=1 Tax=Clostridium sp. TaxID=1506 RepID=UPI00303E545B